MVKLPDPQRCKHCGQRGHVVDTRMKEGFRQRRRRCSTCMVPSRRDASKLVAHTWDSFETLINPRRLKEKPTTSQSSPHHI